MKNLTLTLLLITGTSSLAAAEPEFERLFNGENLEGWVGDPKLWSVQDGAITGVTTDEAPLPHNKFLIWDDEVENFELRVKARVFGANNSGIQYRSKQLKDVGEFVVAGYQCDIHPQYTGLLIHEKGRLILAMNGQEVMIDNDDKKWLTGMNPAPAIKLDEWNTFEVIAIGNKLVHKVNGEVYTVAIDHNEKGRDLKGVLAFQIHKGPAMRVQFKDIELKRLPSGGVLSLADAPIPENAKEAPGRQQAGRGQARRNAARPVATASTPANIHILAQATNGELARIIAEGNQEPEGLSDLDAQRYEKWLQAVMNTHEAAWTYHKRGIISEKGDDIRFSSGGGVQGRDRNKEQAEKVSHSGD